MIPNPNNFCGGAFSDWLEVNLIKQCNAKCSWCIEKNGYHPKKIVSWKTIAKKAIGSNAKNILLLGGEPTLYEDLEPLINYLKENKCNVWLTTNGSKLFSSFAKKYLYNIKGINISIHHYNMKKNKKITGLSIKKENIIKSVNELHNNDIIVRMNCNCIKGAIDSEKEILKYIKFAKDLKVDSVRFAELKDDKDNFVNLAKELNYKYGLNDNPFLYGCNINTNIYNFPVNFRQMCGLQTSKRVKPIKPKQAVKKVLYYDGKIYNGWQTIRKEKIMTDKELAKLLQDVAEGTVSPIEAALQLGRKIKISEPKQPKNLPSDGGGCHY